MAVFGFSRFGVSGLGWRDGLNRLNESGARLEGGGSKVECDVDDV